jgi:hypothetical protein
MFVTEVILFVIILSGVYQRNSGRHILSTMYREVRGLCRHRLSFLTPFVGPNLACHCGIGTAAPCGENRIVSLGRQFDRSTD